MPLEDFLAKKEKKKSKKKQNPQELIEKLKKTTISIQEQNGDNNTVSLKFSKYDKDDEWEKLEDDEVEPDVPLPLSCKLVEDSASDFMGYNETDEKTIPEPEEEKKVWGAKLFPSEEKAAAENVEAESTAPPEPAKPKIYIPIPLRAGGASRLAKAAKPNVASDSDFPTLDAAISDAPTKNEPASGAVKTSNVNKSVADDDGEWTQAGAPRRPNRNVDNLPIAPSSTTKAAYVPPSLRRGGFEGRTSEMPSNRQEGSFSNWSRSEIPSNRQEGSFSSWSRSEMPSNRQDSSVGNWSRSEVPSSVGSWTRSRDEFAPRPSMLGNRSDLLSYSDNQAPPSGGWSRGKVITNPEPASAFPPSGNKWGAAPFPRSDNNDRETSGWASKVFVKTFKETVREKSDFEIAQTNRFSKLEGT